MTGHHWWTEDDTRLHRGHCLLLVVVLRGRTISRTHYLHAGRQHGGGGGVDNVMGGLMVDCLGHGHKSWRRGRDSHGRQLVLDHERLLIVGSRCLLLEVLRGAAIIVVVSIRIAIG